MWSAYWRFEAVEERRIAGLAHLDGRMGVLVHPGFGDDRESANGVMIVRVNAETAALAGEGTVTVETTIEGQIGALSVTNPPIGQPHLPERTIIGQQPGKPPLWTRTQVSSEVDVVLTKAEALALHERGRAVALAWLQQGNLPVQPTWRRRSLQLDVEWRRVRKDWPEGTNLPARMVLKQARSLGPRRRLTVEALAGHGAPADLFDAALEVKRVTCACGPKVLTFWTLVTDPAWAVFPFAVDPFIAHLRMSPAPGASGGMSRDASHLDFMAVTTKAEPFAATINFDAQTASKWDADTVNLTVGGDCVVGGVVEVSGLLCVSEQLEGGPAAWLLGLLVGE